MSQKSSKALLCFYLACFLILLIPFKPIMADSQRDKLNRYTDSLYTLIQSASGKEKINLKITYGSAMRRTDREIAESMMQQGLEMAIAGNHHELAMEALLSLNHMYNEFGNRAKTREVLMQRIDYANKYGFPEEEAHSHNLIARFYLNQNHFDSADLHLDEAEHLYEQLQHFNGLGEVWDKRGLKYLFQNKYHESNPYFYKALELLEQGDSTFLIGIVNYHLGYSFFNTGDFEPALLYVHRALEGWESLNNIGLAPYWNANEMIGNIYFKIKRFQKALEFHRKALSIREKAYKGIKPDATNLSYAYSYNNIAECFFELNQLDSAFWYAEKSLAIKLRPASVSSAHDIGNSYLNTSRILAQLGNMERAVVYVDSAIYYYDLAEWKDGLANSYLLSGKLQTDESNYSMAIEYLERALAISSNTGAKATQKKTYQQLADTYAKSGRYQESNKAMLEYTRLNDSIFNADMNKRIAEMEVKYAVQQKETENAFLRKQNADQQKMQTYLLALSILFVLLGLALMAVVIFLRRNLSQKETILNAQNELNKLKEVQYAKEIERKNLEVLRLVESIKNKNNMLEQVKQTMLDEIKQNCNAPVESFHRTVRTIQSHILNDQDWELLSKQVNELSAGFINKLHQAYPMLTSNDLKLCTYLKLNLNNREIASMLNVTDESVRKQKYRLKKKLGLNGENLEQFVNAL